MGAGVGSHRGTLDEVINMPPCKDMALDKALNRKSLGFYLWDLATCTNKILQKDDDWVFNVTMLNMYSS